jgi:hypothetical protein
VRNQVSQPYNTSGKITVLEMKNYTEFWSVNHKKRELCGNIDTDWRITLKGYRCDDM